MLRLELLKCLSKRDLLLLNIRTFKANVHPAPFLSHRIVSRHTNGSCTSGTETISKTLWTDKCKVCQLSQGREARIARPRSQVQASVWEKELFSAKTACLHPETPCSVLSYLKRKGTMWGAKQNRLKFGRVTLTEVNLLNAGWQTISASRNWVQLYQGLQVTPCQVYRG